MLLHMLVRGTVAAAGVVAVVDPEMELILLLPRFICQDVSEILMPTFFPLHI